jgi:hypothetical protein
VPRKGAGSNKGGKRKKKNEDGSSKDVKKEFLDYHDESE